MKLLYFIVLCMFGCIYSAYANEELLPVDDPDALLAVIEEAGTVNHHNAVINNQLIGKDFDSSSHTPYEIVLAHIQTGDEKWLKVADALNCCVDAGSAEELDIARAIAFTHSPEAVFKRTAISALGGVCIVPFGEPTKAEFDEHVKAVKAALKRIKDPALQDKKIECSKLIDEVRWNNWEN